MKKLSQVSTGSVLLFAMFFFAAGMVCATFEIFPYSLIQGSYRSLKDPFSDQHEIKPPSIVWHLVKDKAAAQEFSEEQREAISNLGSLPYLRGSQAGGDGQNVTIYDPDRSFNGLNFYVSGHGPEAFLIDMNGKLLHQWRCEFESVWPDSLPFKEWRVHRTFWRRARLFPNGDVLAIFEGIGLVKLDKDSNILWSYQGRTHHDVHIADNGDLYCLTRKRRTEHDRIQVKDWIYEDFVTVLDANGQELRRVSILDCFLNSDYSSFLVHLTEEGDILHTNTVEPISPAVAARYPNFKAGQVLVSIPMLNTIAVLDLDKVQVVWSASGMWLFQHQPTFLDNGNILIFDNLGALGKSKVIEFNPLTQEIAWAYRSTPERELLSRTSGSVQRLPNGNTMIVESNAGRALEVTPDKEIVWAFINPHRAGDNNEFIATLFDVIRIDRVTLRDQAWISSASATN